ncbi:MAG: hypothetical protein JO368_01310 [Acidimicrobiales bacterium]|nr:hypothetical protein [Acidimicrobiales bacterium]
MTIQTENNVLDGLDGVAPPGTVQWDDFHVFNQSPGVDVAVSEAVDGTGAMAFFAFPSSDAAQAFVNDPPTHLSGIGDYAALESLTPVPGAPAGADVYDLRGCVSPNGLVVGCTGGSPTRSGGVAVVVPLDDFVLVAVSWHPADAASPATQQRAFTEVADGQALWTRTPH